MKTFKCVLKFRENDGSRSRQRGITIVEYAVAAALVTGTVLVSFGALGLQIGDVLNAIANGIS